MARINRWRALSCAVLVLAVCLLAGSALAQRSNGNGKGGGGDEALPANADIAYHTKGGKVVLMDTVTGETGILDTDGNGPSWSPDGSQVAYLSNSGWDIVIKNSDGSGSVQYVTTVTERTWFGRIDWSRAPTPDGRELLIYPDLAADPSAGWSIYAIGTDGTGKVELIDADANGLLDGPRWSPAGDRFIYSSQSLGETVVCTVDLVLVGGELQLAVVGSAPLPVGGFERDWSNDGDWIVIESNNDLWMIDARDLNNFYQLTFTPDERERYPTFDATDSRIYFMTYDRFDRLFSIDAATGGDLRQESNEKSVFMPQCRRD